MTGDETGDMDMSELERLCKEHNITAEHVATPIRKVDPDGWEHWHSTVRLTRGTPGDDNYGHMTVPYRRGMAHDRDALDVADVLYSVLSDAFYGAMTFHEFCEEQGENEDSRRAHARWQACRRMDRDALPLLFTFPGDAELLETLRNAEH